MFSESIKENQTLKTLKLQQNLISLSFIESVTKSIAQNKDFRYENLTDGLRQNRDALTGKNAKDIERVKKKRANNRKILFLLKRYIADRREHQAKSNDFYESGLVIEKNMIETGKEQLSLLYEQLSIANRDLTRVKAYGEKKCEQIDHDQKQAERLIAHQKEQIEIYNDELEEKKVQQAIESSELNTRLALRHRDMKDALKRKERLQQEVKAL